MPSRPPETQLGLVLVCHNLRLNAGAMRRYYDLLLAAMTVLGVPPTEVAGVGPGWPERFRQFERVHTRLESGSFDELAGFSLRHLRPERDVSNWGFFDWTSYACVTTENLKVKSRSPRLVGWAHLYEDADVSESVVIPVLMDLAREFIESYGYITFVTRKNKSYAWGDGFEDGRATWMVSYEDHHKLTLLRDVHPYNFLSEKYLAAPVGRGTLRQWIEASAEHGTLEKFTKRVFLWRPPVERIPAIRERLFRAGLLLFWDHFQPGNEWYGKAGKPVGDSVEIPECFRAETYRGRDPRVTG